MLLPAPDGPTSATTSPCSISAEKFSQHRPAVVVGERHVLEADVADDVRQRDRIGRIVALDRQVEDLEHPPGADERAREIAEEDREPVHRVDQQPGGDPEPERGRRREVPDRHLARREHDHRAKRDITTSDSTGVCVWLNCVTFMYAAK